MSKECVCELCDKALSSKRSLKIHQEKLIPCDFRCRECPFKGTDRHQFYRHQTAAHPDMKRIKQKKEKTVSADEEIDEFPMFQVEEPEESKEPYMIPIEDFQGGRSGNFQGGKNLINHLMKIAKETDKQVVFIQYNVFNVYNPPANMDPEQIAAHAFRASDYESALRCLETPNNTKQIAAGIINQMHSDPERPQMHTIKMRKDLSRKQVDIYSRTANGTPGEWLPYAYAAALHKLSEHAAALIYDALCGSISVFDFKFRKERRGLCVSLPTLIENKRIIVYDENENDQDLAMVYPYKHDISLRVELVEDELFDVPKNDEEINRKKTLLNKHIKSKGREVIELLRDIKFTDKDIGMFLEKTRRPLA